MMTTNVTYTQDAIEVLFTDNTYLLESCRDSRVEAVQSFIDTEKNLATEEDNDKKSIIEGFTGMTIDIVALKNLFTIADISEVYSEWYDGMACGEEMRVVVKKVSIDEFLQNAYDEGDIMHPNFDCAEYFVKDGKLCYVEALFLEQTL